MVRHHRRSNWEIETKDIRKLSRRKARHSSKLLIKANRFDDIQDPRGSQGWDSW